MAVAAVVAPDPRLIVSIDMANPKPLVSVACFCEQLIEDKDGMFSAIRMIDTVTITVIAPSGVELPKDLQPMLDLTGLVSLKSGDLSGTHSVSLRLRRTDGTSHILGDWPLEFKGGEHGANLKIKLQLAVKQYGLCWFDVLFEGEALTSIPLKLVQGEAGQSPRSGA